jgi:calcineurin-like phosphoesterase family protein
MYKRLKFQDQSKVFVVSDCHFRHDRDFIWGKRGFNNSDEHNQSLINEWNHRVDNESDVIQLGDFMFGDQDGRYMLEVIRKLNFSTLYLMGGNHVSGFKALYNKALTIKNNETLPEYEIYPLEYDVDGRNVIFLPNLVEIVAEKRLFVLCHYPIVSQKDFRYNYL